MSASRAILGALTAASAGIALAGCDGGGSDDAGEYRSRPPDAVLECLRSKGFDARSSGRIESRDRDEPDVELIVSGRKASAFLAFYDDLSRAERLEPELTENAERFDGVVEGGDRVTVVFTGKPAPDVRKDVRDCVTGR